MREAVKLLHKLSRELKTLEDIAGLLNWDMQTCMPPGGAASRAEQQAVLQVELHRRVRSMEMARALKPFSRAISLETLNTRDRALVREMKRKVTRARKVPAALVEEMARLDALSYQRWAEAKAKGDFEAFAPFLSKQVAVKRKLAECLGYKESPYDALLDLFEPGATAGWIEELFERLKARLVPGVRKWSRGKNSPSAALLKKGSFPEDRQRAFHRAVLDRMGFDREAGRLDESVHPFTASCGGSCDVRITTHLSSTNVWKGLFATLHEGGHALYEQGLKTLDYGQLAVGASTAVHESQARLWENLVGRSLPFWRFWLPRFKRFFPDALAGVKCAEFYRAVNRVTPSFIRIEADEVTYALHIILRFEIERDLIEGRMKVKRTPDAWNMKMKEYLGVVPPDHRSGVLQDIHWSAGYFGYFPCYALGNLYAAQFYAEALRGVPDLETRIAAGDCNTLLEWLREKIHRFGRMYSARDLVVRVTKKPLAPDDFLDHLDSKYGSIYR